MGCFWEVDRAGILFMQLDCELLKLVQSAAYVECHVQSHLNTVAPGSSSVLKAAVLGIII